MVRPGLKGFYLNLQDLHPLHIMSLDRSVPSMTQSRSQP
jgi:hypothetical protein